MNSPKPSKIYEGKKQMDRGARGLSKTKLEVHYECLTKPNYYALEIQTKQWKQNITS